MHSRIGCNLVDDRHDDLEGFYTLAAYEAVLHDYARYLEFIGYLEFSHVTEITPQEAERLGHLARDIGFVPWSIHSEHLNAGDDLKHYLDVQTHEAEVCAALGCQVMVCHLPNLQPYLEVQRDVEIVGKVADLTHRYGLRLAVETCFYSENNGDVLPDAELVLEVVRQLNRKDVGINVDTGHCFFGQARCREKLLRRILDGEEPQMLPDLVRRVGNRLFTTHLQDNFGLHDDHQAPGMGYIDWGKLMPAFLETGYQGPFIMELTGNKAKLQRSVPEMRHFPLEREIIFAASYLKQLIKENSK